MNYLQSLYLKSKIGFFKFTFFLKNFRFPATIDYFRNKLNKLPWSGYFKKNNKTMLRDYTFDGLVKEIDLTKPSVFHAEEKSITKVTLAYDSESNEFKGMYLNGGLTYQSTDNVVSILNSLPGIEAKAVRVDLGPTSDSNQVPIEESSLKIVT